MTNTHAPLCLNGVTLSYPDGDARITALEAVSLEVPGGCVSAVVGPSGSGKSSLLAVAATLMSPDTGKVVIDGTETAGMNRGELTALRRRKIGMVFQQPNLLPALTALEQLQVMAHFHGGNMKSARLRAGELLDAVGLAAQAGRRPHQLSGGQRQRVNIARALMNEPKVLLVDEPTSALDKERGAAVVSLLTELTRLRETATVLVTHDREQLAAVDRVAEMHDGRLSSRSPIAASSGTSSPIRRPASGSPATPDPFR